ncbi:hypothetical protein HD554DRAFT_1024689 [Boletus coccyginus]|nr:hypothetical protein HD554DRAFT_1024689 [Boletus coccyginus]
MVSIFDHLFDSMQRLCCCTAVLFYLVKSHEFHSRRFMPNSVQVNVLYDVLGVLTLTVFVENPLYFVQVALYPLFAIAGQRVVLNLRGFRSQEYSTRDISRLVDRGIAEMQRRSFWQSLDLWMNDPHQELELIEELTRYRTTRTTQSQAQDTCPRRQVMHCMIYSCISVLSADASHTYSIPSLPRRSSRILF